MSLTVVETTNIKIPPTINKIAAIKENILSSLTNGKTIPLVIVLQ